MLVTDLIEKAQCTNKRMISAQATAARSKDKTKLILPLIINLVQPRDRRPTLSASSNRKAQQFLVCVAA